MRPNGVQATSSQVASLGSQVHYISEGVREPGSKGTLSPRCHGTRLAGPDSGEPPKSARALNGVVLPARRSESHPPSLK